MGNLKCAKFGLTKFIIFSITKYINPYLSYN